jgi:2-polyprenylphenol hydroxylase and related flavodoxin oxidoreductases
MYKIVEKRKLADAIYLFKIEAHWIANSANPGQFLIVRLGRNGERIPLTICDYDKALGTVTIVVQEIGNSSKMICKLDVGDCFNDVVGPLGNKSNFVSFDDNILKNKNIFLLQGVLAQLLCIRK